MSMIYTMKNQRPTKELRILNRELNKLKISTPMGKFLTLIACHTNTELKLKSILQNLKYLKFGGNKIVIINSIDSEFNEQLKENVRKTYPEIEYIEIPNNSQLDVGKWMSYLKNNFTGTSFNYVTFTNDSYLLDGSLLHFYKGALDSSKDLYGFTSSTQVHYHYQSYLFAIRPKALGVFIKHYLKVSPSLQDYMSVVGNIELQLERIYRHSRAVLMDLGSFPGNTGRNIFFNSDTLYAKLRDMGILPMIKIKRIDSVANNISDMSHKKIQTNPDSLYSAHQEHYSNYTTISVRGRTTSKPTSFPTSMNMAGLIVGSHQNFSY